jgi:glutathione S-transferase
MATHVVCLDGTNHSKTQSCPTNIAHLFDCLGGAPAEAGNGSWETRLAAPAPLTGKYLPGVGSEGSLPLRILGNAFGDGIAELIIRGYTFLSREWSPGDRVIITGFSRGATAARALAGLVVGKGLLDRSRYDPSRKDDAYGRAIAAWYAYRKGQPDLANQERLMFIRTVLGEVPKLTPSDYTAPINVMAVGVFDTVSSLGLPRLDWKGGAVFDFSICDTTLSPRVERGFHALAADEMRDLFTPTFWAARPGTIVQEIFPGGHSDVGGGYAEHGLSDCSLDWMAGRLNSVCNVFQLQRLGRNFIPNIRDAAHDDARVFPFSATPSRARAFPKEAAPSGTLKSRWKKPARTLPGTITAPYVPRGKYADGSKIL